jgi:hypothetical protein
MIYIGLGNGSIVENNKDRMAYVNKLSNNKEQIISLVNNIFSALNSNNIDEVNEQLKCLFHEAIFTYEMGNVIDIHNRLDSKSLEILRHNIIKNCIKNPTKGFVWNLYNEYRMLTKIA